MNTLTFQVAVSKQCPHRDEVDQGTVRVTVPADTAPELHAARAFLDSLAGQSLTHEDYTDRLHARFGGTVITRWRTAGMDIECCAVPSEPDRRDA